MSDEPPDSPKEIARILDDLDSQLPACRDNTMKAIFPLAANRFIKPIRKGELVVISRGMLRRIRDLLNE